MNEKIKSIFQIFFPLLLGGIISFIIKDSIDYSYLIKPPLAPPKILFPIMWTIIYFLMGLSYYLLNKENSSTILEKCIYHTQLFVNALWSIIFFYLKNRLLACFWIVLLDVLVLIMLFTFYKKEKISAYLNILYFIWILFATYLTIGIYLLN